MAAGRPPTVGADVIKDSRGSEVTDAKRGFQGQSGEKTGAGKRFVSGRGWLVS